MSVVRVETTDRTALARLHPDGARMALERATTVDDAKQVVDMAEAARTCSRLARESLAMQNQWAEVKLRAERKAGELLRDNPEIGRGKTGNLPVFLGLPEAERSKAQTLSSRWQQVASIPEPEFDAYIAEAHNEAKELTSVGARKLAKRLAAADKPTVEPPHLRVVPEDVPEVFSAVVIDPPWRYDNKATRGAAEDHYPTMSLDELAALRIPGADDSHLYLWVTAAFMRDGFDLLDAWGFTYKTVLTWCKPSIGMGNYFRVNTEHVLFAVRGKHPTLRNDEGTWFEARRAGHSAKPESFYDLVERCSPGPYMEMFARRRRMGWHVWGNEA